MHTIMYTILHTIMYTIMYSIMCRFQRFQDTYGNLDVEAAQLQGTGWFTEDPWEITTKFGGVWKTANYRAGDVLVFTLRYLPHPTSDKTGLK